MPTRAVFLFLFLLHTFASTCCCLPIFANEDSLDLDLSYRQSEAFKFALHSTAAYCNVTVGGPWSCGPCSGVGDEFEVFATFSGAKTNTFGYIGYYTPTNTAIISFRGTQFGSLINWIDDLKFGGVNPFPDLGGATVHTGFYSAFLSIREQVREAVRQLGLSRTVDKLYITGHSLGAALATMCAVDLSVYRIQLNYAAENTLPFPTVTGVYTFGSPRIGNKVFRKFFNDHVTHSWRIVNHRDMVPHLPPASLHFSHVSREVWYPTENDLTYKVCGKSGEDKRCSSSLWIATSIEDHLRYVTIQMGSYQCATLPPPPPPDTNYPTEPPTSQPPSPPSPSDNPSSSNADDSSEHEGIDEDDDMTEFRIRLLNGDYVIIPSKSGDTPRPVYDGTQIFIGQ